MAKEYMEKEKLLEKLEQLQERIEAWIQINGYGNLSNYKERKNKDGKVVGNNLIGSLLMASIMLSIMTIER